MSKITSNGRLVNKGARKRRVVATSWIVDDDPELEALFQSLKGTGQLSAEMRRLLKLALEVEQGQSPQTVITILEEIKTKLHRLDDINRRLDKIDRQLVGYRRSETPVEYKTGADEDEGVDPSDLPDDVLDNILGIG